MSHCGMPEDRVMKQVVFGRMEGQTEEEEKRRWRDDVEQWCNNDLHILSMKAMEWRQMVKHALDTNGH